MSDQERVQIEPERLAYHEAGHAVIARAVHLPIRRVSIIPDAKLNALGSCSVGHASNASWALAHIAHCWAGMLAESRLCAERGWNTDNLVLGGWSDLQGANMFVEMASMGDERVEDVYSMWGCWRAEQALLVYWPVVQELAVLLLERQTLPGKEVTRLIDTRLKALEPERKQQEANEQAHIAARLESFYLEQQAALAAIAQRRQTAKQRAIRATYQWIADEVGRIIQEGAPIWYALLTAETMRVAGDTRQTRQMCAGILVDAAQTLRQAIKSEAA